MMRFGTAGSLRLAVLCAVALFFSCTLTGCFGSTTGQEQPANETAAGESVFTGASDHGMVINFDSESITLRPDEGNDEIAMISLEDTGEEHKINYADDCEFSIISGNASTGDYSESAATKDTIKKDSIVFVWTNVDGLAEKVAIFRNE